MPVSEKEDPRLRKLLGSLLVPRITVGIHDGEGGQTHPNALNGESIAEIAEAHEFGLGVPQRSWLRAFVDEQRPQIQKDITRLSKRLLSVPPRQVAELIALRIQSQIQKRIADGIGPKNSEETIAQKTGSTPLIDSGVFRSAIVGKVG